MWNLVADVGGTNMRLAAISNAGSIIDQQSFGSKGEVSVPAACQAFVAQHTTPPAGVVVAAAGVVKDGEVELTNAKKQRFSEADLALASGTDNVTILNDFEAAAWSLSTVTPADVTPLQGGQDIPMGPRLIIGPGTGLGVGSLVWANGQPNVVRGEGGHVTLSPQSAQELAYFQALIEIWPEVQIGSGIAIEAEAILSGTGIPRFYRAIAKVHNKPQLTLEAEDVFMAAQQGTDPCALTAIDLFQKYLGMIAGDLGLVIDAKGGVFITGGVALSNPWLFDDKFLQAFNAGGRHSAWRAEFPVYLYQNPNFGLLGARNFISSR
ncbi:ROK family protein [Aliiroseovarius lamellibrachiae]|uniref:glucokinase n=1 Tax=Aliiroseovarius lamellibrachiae TaxID=1924933 RepID=UPI001BE0E28F|nr:ROK family protein [Aliiroseovarius lamellibrachiae]MBT2130571.1 ROK family protein [Aliiroseovarius lamellibrachiae]